MSTIAINRENYTVREENVSLKERIKNYFTENAAIISAGLLSLNGNANAYQLYQLYRLLK